MPCVSRYCQALRSALAFPLLGVILTPSPQHLQPVSQGGPATCLAVAEEGLAVAAWPWALPSAEDDYTIVKEERIDSLCLDS